MIFDITSEKLKNAFRSVVRNADQNLLINTLESDLTAKVQILYLLNINILIILYYFSFIKIYQRFYILANNIKSVTNIEYELLANQSSSTGLEIEKVLLIESFLSYSFV